ncbi:MAG: archaeal histone A [Candidatus Micrarchaeota archaeon]|nr:MAG: archaeal histone A [Candidatus Micrarchaeota archaeon]
MYIKRSALKKLLKDNGAKRISPAAIEELERYLEAYAIAIAKKAVLLAKHAKRRTVKKSDIRLAIK